MINVKQSQFWNHDVIGDVINISFNHTKFCVCINTQVLKLASRYSGQCSKDVVSCVLIGSCNYKSIDKIDILVDRIECNLASYLSDNKLICKDDICIPLKCFKSQNDLNFSEDDFIVTVKEMIKNYEDSSFYTSISNLFSIRAYAGFVSNEGISGVKYNTSPNLNWIELKLVYPDIHLTVFPIGQIPVFRSALLSSFENNIFSNEDENIFTFGYLTADHSSKLHFLLHSDDRVRTSSLVGVWVHGGFDESDLFVLIACLKYISLHKSINRICKPPFSFLLARFTEDKNEPIKYFDIKWPLGPSEDQDSILRFINFKLKSSSDNLDSYYQSKVGSNSINFITKLVSASSNDKALITLSRAWKSYLSNLTESFISDDPTPRVIRNQWQLIQSIPSNEFQGLEVSDVSLIAKESNCDSSCNSNTFNRSACLNETQLDMENFKENSNNLISKISINSNKEVDEAVPRSLAHKQKLMSPNYIPLSRDEVSKPPFQQVPFFPPQIFPYQQIIPTQLNPYLLCTPNMYFTTGQMLPVVNKPPKLPKPKDDSVKTSDINHFRKEDVQKIKKSASHPFHLQNASTNAKVDKSVITDVTNHTNKIPKRVLQLDREEDLATLETLVQQIINQRRQNKSSTVSIGTNTSSVFPGQESRKTIEVSTDLPSFVEGNVCPRCCHRNPELTEKSIMFSDKETCYQQNLCASKDNLSNDPSSSSLTHSECSNEDDNSENVPSESQQFKDLLKNLESFVEEVRSNSFHRTENGKSLIENHNAEECKIDIIEEAVKNLRVLEVNRDFEHQYWDTIQKSKPRLSEETSYELEDQMNLERSSLDATILQQKINYVSLFLNSSSVTLSESSDNSFRRSSVGEQSVFIEELALKYLKKAAKDLDKMQKSKRFIGDSSQFSNEVSVNTNAYLKRHHLNSNFHVSEMNSAAYYSSIRLPDGHSLPKNKILISSTPAPSGQPFPDKCFKKPENRDLSTEETNWSGVKILDGLNLQPTILPMVSQDVVDSWSQKLRQSHLGKCSYSEEAANVLDIEKLKQLPKYL